MINIYRDDFECLIHHIIKYKLHGEEKEYANKLFKDNIDWVFKDPLLALASFALATQALTDTLLEMGNRVVQEEDKDKSKYGFEVEEDKDKSKYGFEVQ